MSFSRHVRDRLGRLRRSHVGIALLLVVLLIIWMASGTFFRAKTEAPETEPVTKEETAYRVETAMLRAEEHAPSQVIQGQLEALRTVDIRSQIGAHVAERAVDWGAQVVKDQILFELDPETRAAELQRAEADLKLRQAELRAGESLVEKNLISETEFLRLKSAAATAQAERDLVAQELAYAEVRAPFEGIIDRLPVEQGDYVQVGQSLATLIDISSLRLIGYVPQQQVYPLQPGLEVEASLLDGTTLAGTLTFVASSAEESTRSFRVEARIENPNLRPIAGSSATLSIRLPKQKAHRLTPALLVLGEDGQLGVKAVSPDQRVEFLPLNILSFDTDGVWVDGLPEEIEIITLGAGFVAEGDAVDPVKAEQP